MRILARSLITLLFVLGLSASAFAGTVSTYTADEAEALNMYDGT